MLNLVDLIIVIYTVRKWLPRIATILNNLLQQIKLAQGHPIDEMTSAIFQLLLPQKPRVVNLNNARGKLGSSNAADVGLHNRYFSKREEFSKTDFWTQVLASRKPFARCRLSLLIRTLAHATHW